ncbi:MAG: potassium transporter TrkG [Amaricoccus sp.]|uniref:TrkH family potassium uptake protein n=1 Tax=Amaricoccus sp. TaxID=1872485 RepID=UPI0039E2C209
MRLIRQFPALVVLVLVAAAAMLAPALHAARLRDWDVARAFLDHAVLFALVAALVGLAATGRPPPRVPARALLLAILLAYLILPALLAAPFAASVPGLGFGRAYFEMLSCLTTTGATLFDRPASLAEPLHLWRAIVGWLGGGMVLVLAWGILEPLNLGGFEIAEESARRERQRSGTIDEARARIVRVFRLVAPLYVGLTGLLALILIVAGDRPFVAVCHAMSTLSTSGISPVGGLAGGRSGMPGELAIAIFLLPAVSHRVLGALAGRPLPGRSDPEVQLMLISVLAVTLVLFLRAFVGAAAIERSDDLATAGRAIWGGLFTVLSFLTTTGFESHDWRTLQLWSDLPSPGPLLLAVAVIGGGVATTAGGVKLLRVYALYRLGLREMDRLIHPSGVGRRGRGDKLISRRGARIAFIFLMLFLIALSLTMMALAATGMSFNQSLAIAVAALTTCGQAIHVLDGGASYAALPAPALGVLSLAMIVGRMETLVVVALVSLLRWRG